MSENKKLLLSKAISTKMENRNKDIKKDENGDYPVIVGAVNHFTAGGELYVAEEVNDKLFFGGEHTEADYFSTTHGAYLSGIREAEKIIALL